MNDPGVVGEAVEEYGVWCEVCCGVACGCEIILLSSGGPCMGCTVSVCGVGLVDVVHYVLSCLGCGVDSGLVSYGGVYGVLLHGVISSPSTGYVDGTGGLQWCSVV